MTQMQTILQAPTVWGNSGDRFGGVEDAEYAVDLDKALLDGLSERGKTAFTEYVGLLRQWTGRDPNGQISTDATNHRAFLNDAVAVDNNLQKRLELMEILAAEGALGHSDLGIYKPYVVADRAAIARPDPDKEAYEAYMERRANLRDNLGLQTLRISAAEYQELAKRIQGTIAKGDEAHIANQRDYIAMRKEIAQENARHPRFVAEVAHASSGTLFDELLVDLDRDDLRTNTEAASILDSNGAWLADSRTRAALFAEEVAKRGVFENSSNGSGRVRAYIGMVEMGKQIVSDPVAIKEFASIQMDKVAQARSGNKDLDASVEMAASGENQLRQLGGKDYEIGMAALENKPFSNELSLSFFQSIAGGYDLPRKVQREVFGYVQDPNDLYTTRQEMANAVGKKPSLKGAVKEFALGEENGVGDAYSACQMVQKDPVRMFLAAHSAFQIQFDQGSPKAGLSFSVMEHLSTRMLGDPDMIARLANADMDAAMALQQFDPRTRQEVADALGGDAFEKKVYDTLVANNLVVADSNKTMVQIKGEQIVSQDGATINLAERMQPKSAQLIAFPDDKGGFIAYVSESARAAGEGISIKGPIQRLETKEEISERVAEENTQREKNGQAPLSPEEVRFYQEHPEKIPVDLGQHTRRKQGPDKNGEPLPHDPIILHAAFLENGQVALATTPEDVQAGKAALITSGNVSDKIPSQRGPEDTPVAVITAAAYKDGPYVKVLEGGHVAVAATKSDMEAGRGVEMNLYGIDVPPPGKDHATKDNMYDAGNAARDHLQSIIERHGTRGMQFTTVDGRDGQKELRIRLNTQEDLSMRMIRDGYALPSDCDLTRTKREQFASDAERNGRGLWKHGFPEMNENWRSASLVPHLSRRDKSARLTANVNMAFAKNPSHAARIFSDRGARPFAMPLGENWNHPGYMREALDAVHMNPQRMKKLYEENLKVMEELRKREDDKDPTKKLTKSEKIAHDKLCVGTHLVGMALVRAGERYDPKTKKVTYAYGITPADVQKSTSRMLSERGMKISEGMGYALSRLSDNTGKAAQWAGRNSKDFFDYLVRVGDQFTQ